MIGKLLCWLGLHDYDDSRIQYDLAYRKLDCTRCGNTKYEPR